jgi:hypothetical protein
MVGKEELDSWLEQQRQQSTPKDQAEAVPHAGASATDTEKVQPEAPLPALTPEEVGLSDNLAHGMITVPPIVAHPIVAHPIVAVASWSSDLSTLCVQPGSVCHGRLTSTPVSHLFFVLLLFPSQEVCHSGENAGHRINVGSLKPLILKRP